MPLIAVHSRPVQFVAGVVLRPFDDDLPHRYSNPSRCRTYRHEEMELAALLSGPRKLTAVAPPLNDGRTMAAEPDGAC